MEMDRVARQHCGSASAGARCWAFAANNGGVDDVSGRRQRLEGATRRFVDADKPQRSWRHRFSSCSSETAAAGGVRWIKTSRPSRLQQQQQQLVVRTWLTATALALAVLLAATAVTTLAASTDSESNQDKPVVTFVLVGATGNLAKKYLIQSLFDAFESHQDEMHLNIFACARQPEAKAWPTVQEAISRVECGKAPTNDRHPMSEQQCQQRRQAFLQHVTYAKLKTAEDYASLGAVMNETGSRESARVFYLSVPPSAYPTIASWIDASCRPASSMASLRVALEKPFGRDYHTARELHVELSRYLQPQEVFRIDHYLGKRGVMQISAFAAANRDLFLSHFNRHHVERVEIIMKETEDCSGRTRFFDEYGIVRDVLQNHLTEMAVLLALDPVLGTGPDAKMGVLSKMTAANAGRAVYGQYRDYAQHVAGDHGEALNTTTPTFAGATVYINDFRWKHTPFLLVAGKRMSERVAFARVRFKPSPHVCLTEHCDVNRIEYHVQGHGREPCVTVWGDFPQLQVPAGWTVQHNTSVSTALCPGEDLGSLSPYTQLLDGLITGDGSKFVSSQTLLRSWQIWTPLVNAVMESRVYAREEDVHFTMDKRGALRFVGSDDGGGGGGGGPSAPHVSDKAPFWAKKKKEKEKEGLEAEEREKAVEEEHKERLEKAQDEGARGHQKDEL